MTLPGLLIASHLRFIAQHLEEGPIGEDLLQQLLVSLHLAPVCSRSQRCTCRCACAWVGPQRTAPCRMILFLQQSSVEWASSLWLRVIQEVDPHFKRTVGGRAGYPGLGWLGSAEFSLRHRPLASSRPRLPDSGCQKYRTCSPACAPACPLMGGWSGCQKQRSCRVP